MCIRKVYHNVYADGLEDVTERVKTCVPGTMCKNPIVQEKTRHFSCARSEALATTGKREYRANGGASLQPAFAPVMMPTPPGSSAGMSSARRSDVSSGVSGASSGSRRLSGSWSNASPRSSYTGNSSSPSSSSMRASPSAGGGGDYSHPPSASRSRPIPIKRSNSMTSHGYYSSAPLTPPESHGRRPIIHDHDRSERERERLPRMTKTSASPSSSTYSSSSRPAADVYEYASSSRLRDRFQRHEGTNSRSHYDNGGVSASNDFLHPSTASRRRSRANSSPLGYGSAEDEHDQAERRRRREAARERASVMPSSLPSFNNIDVYGSSYASNHSRGSRSSREDYDEYREPRNTSRVRRSSISSASPSPAAASVKKVLRFEDEQRQEQNSRISARPKLSRSETLRGNDSNNSNLQGEVKSILKNGSNTNTPAASPQRSASTSRRRSESSNRRSSMDVDALSAGLSGMSMRGRRTESAERRSDEEYNKRLRDRFEPAPRRYTAGGSHRRRTEIMYPETGQYRFM